MLRRLKSKRVFWWIVLIGSITGLILIFISSVVADLENQTSSANYLRGLIDKTFIARVVYEVGTYSTNDAVSAVSIGFLSSLIPLSFIYLFKIPEIRRIAIQAIVNGYYENFLKSVIEKVHAQGGDIENRVIIILPSYELVENKNIYWGHFRRITERLGFSFVQETTDRDFGRNIFSIQKLDSSPLPVFIDMPTTLTTLKTIIELEEDSPVGVIAERSSVKRRFFSLRSQFQQELAKYVREGDWGNITFVEGETLEKFEKEITGIISSYNDMIASQGQPQA